MKFKERLKVLRLNNKLRQSDLAKKLNVSHATVSSWETGNSEPEMIMLIKLSEIFKVTIGQLIGTEEYYE